MAYNINRTDGTKLVTVPDGTTDSGYSSLTLIGKNFAGYGEFLNENFVKLLENFANNSAPSNPLDGQLWYDTASKSMKVYTGTMWKNVSSSSASATAPTSPVLGDSWWDTVAGQFKVWNSTSWVVVGPAFTASQGLSGAIAEAVVDTLGGSHVVVKFYVSNTVVAIVSKDAAFAVNSLPGFATIGPGITLATNVTGNLFNSDVYNSLRLGGVLATDFLRQSIANTVDEKFTIDHDDGITIGADNKVDIKVVTGHLHLQNTDSNKNILVKVKQGGEQITAMTINGTSGLVTVLADPVDPLGVATMQYVDGIVVGPNAAALARSGGNTITGDIRPNANGTRNFGHTDYRFNTIYANTFDGQSTSAKYADLAERFEADQIYSPGTVVELGGAKEITKVNDALCDKVFGVISSKAAYLMNSAAGSNETHPAVAVQGRVPVNVIGKVVKGARLVSAGNGLAKAASASEITPFNVIGRALQDKLTDGEGTIEAVVRLNS